ncbi:hypothetical protein [Botrimarina sp.]|uniref:hypothetical protein n=1 Tax=Botrimarina sp. TaxID=2795802 RepID=UPI0032EB7B38
MRRVRFALIAASLLLLPLGGVGESPTLASERGPTPAAVEPARSSDQPPHRIEAKHLPNPVRVHPKVISGGLPDGDDAFRELQALGVKTVISVDGMRPDVATARRYGLRYVHLPHGYDGVPQRRAKELAKAVRELDGPIYIHCHHGKHRSPAAASVACVAAGMVPESRSVAILEFAGTSPNYRGLYESAREAKPLDAALLDQLAADFPEAASVPPMAEAMVAIGHTHDHLKLVAKAGWRSPPEHPDLDPAHEALLMREHFTELLRTDEVAQEPEEFLRLLRESEEAAQQLEHALRAWSARGAEAAPPDGVGRAADRISARCAACHERFRDVPLGEK